MEEMKQEQPVTAQEEREPAKKHEKEACARDRDAFDNILFLSVFMALGSWITLLTGVVWFLWLIWDSRRPKDGEKQM